jgi:hypothetical protein
MSGLMGAATDLKVALCSFRQYDGFFKIDQQEGNYNGA